MMIWWQNRSLKMRLWCCTVVAVFLLFDIKFGLAASAVKFLPGFQGPLPFEFETGYIGVGEANEVQLFYYFVKSQSNPNKDPLLLWIAGGPGCSALSALLHEIGPVLSDYLPYNGSLPTLSLNPYAYTKVANIIFLDLPVGTGFSYATTSKSNSSDDLQIGGYASQFLRKWLTEHQDYLDHHVYPAGDSYSGYTVPITTRQISEENDLGIKPHINLKGYILGNPATFYPGEQFYTISFTHGMSLISDELYKSLVVKCGDEFVQSFPTNEPCLREFHTTFHQAIKGLYIYNILLPSCDDVASNDSPRMLGEIFQDLKSPTAFKCRDDWLKVSEFWTNDEKVLDALQIRKGTVGAWQQCNVDLAYTEWIDSVIPFHAYLSRKGFRSLIYSGDHDLVVTSSSTLAWIKSLNYSIVDEWRPWTVDGQIAGYTRTYSNQMTFLTVKGAGHNSPQEKPKECLEMLKRWLSYEPL